jgi:hypothetical protein
MKWHNAAERLYIELCDHQDPRPERSYARDRVYPHVATMVPSLHIFPDYSKSTVKISLRLQIIASHGISRALYT